MYVYYHCTRTNRNLTLDQAAKANWARHTPREHYIIIKDLPEVPQSNADLNLRYNLSNLVNNAAATYNIDNMQQYYTQFPIPKRSGGVRLINAPVDPLMVVLRAIKNILQAQTASHNAAYAYVPNRNIKDCAEKHARTNHKWYLKIDIHDFFGSCNPEFIFTSLRKIARFYHMPEDLLRKIIKLACLNNGLPQGTPLSPYLTNQIMLDFDYKMTKFCTQHQVTYTRYADDMYFSANSRNYLLGQVLPKVQLLLQDTPLRINTDKTKICSNCGPNWVLGLMINKDNSVTVGNKTKEQFRAMLADFCRNSAAWQPDEASALLGKLQYYLSIEPLYFQNLLTKYGTKFNMDVRYRIIQRIKNN